MIERVKGWIKASWIKIVAFFAAVLSGIALFRILWTGRKQDPSEQAAQEEKQRIEAHHKETDRIDALREQKIEVLKKKQDEDREKARNDESKGLDDLIKEVDREIADTPKATSTFRKDGGGYHV